MSDPTLRPGTQPLVIPPRRVGATAPLSGGAPAAAGQVPSLAQRAGQLQEVGGKAKAAVEGAQAAVTAGGTVLEGLTKAAEGDVVGGGKQAASAFASTVEGAHHALDQLGKLSETLGVTRLAATARHLRSTVDEASRVGRAGKAANAGAGIAGNVEGAVAATDAVTAGVAKLTEGNLLEGGIEAGKGASETIKAASEVAGNAKKVAEAIGGAEGRLTQVAAGLEQRVGEASRLGKLGSAVGGAAAVAGGAVHVGKGLEQLREGKVLEGAATAIGGVGEVAAGAAQLASAAQGAAPGAAGVVGKVAGRLGPVVGVAVGAVQVATALRGNPEPDYKAAATGAMSAVGSALMPFPPVGTAVGGALVAGSAIVENWGTISRALAGGGDAISRGWKALVG